MRDRDAALTRVDVEEDHEVVREQRVIERHHEDKGKQIRPHLANVDDNASKHRQ